MPRILFLEKICWYFRKFIPKYWLCVKNNASEFRHIRAWKINSWRNTYLVTRHSVYVFKKYDVFEFRFWKFFKVNCVSIFEVDVNSVPMTRAILVQSLFIIIRKYLLQSSTSLILTPWNMQGFSKGREWILTILSKWLL